MLSDSPDVRPTCAQILAENYNWSITSRDVKYYGLDNEDIMKYHEDHFMKTYFKEKLLSFNHFDQKI